MKIHFISDSNLQEKQTIEFPIVFYLDFDIELSEYFRTTEKKPIDNCAKSPPHWTD